MRIGITGASGMLGTALVARLSRNYQVFATSRGRGLENQNINWSCFDLTDLPLLEKWLNIAKPDVLIHCAAIVNVDICEENFDLAKVLHFETTKIISEYLDSKKRRLIYISTDSVFDGKKLKPYIESDLTNPLNVYAKTKLMGEKPVQSINKGLVLRTNIVGLNTKSKASFVKWILDGLIDNKQLNLFHDVYFSPLDVYDLVLVIEKIILNPIYGLHHCSSQDSISKYDFGKLMANVFELPDTNIKQVSIDSIKFKAKRPQNMALDISKISTALKYNFPSVKDTINSLKQQYNIN